MITEQENQEQKLAYMQQDIIITKRMDQIKHKIAVMSGKGGVGKSTMAVNIAASFAKKGYKTGILDVDIHGPNVPKMLKIGKTDLKVNEEGILPVKVGENLKVMSSQFLLSDENSPIIWRGPKKTAAIRQFLSDVSWGNLDILVIDCPPGTGDEHLAILQSIPSIDGIIMVTTPHTVSLDDVEKSINMARHLKIEVLGIVENMSGLICPECETEIPLFGRGGGSEISSKTGIPLLGSIPIDIRFEKEDDVLLVENSNSETSKNILKVVTKIEKQVLKEESAGK
ncbi:MULTISPECIES: Mrp/NBP35 family ATP-binding protein [Methanobacterium]|jgi:Mrp family chromosome partitioning ATPase|uniref:Iron-sulfur cluster carrier protein n=1 Tax=Methanobacterium bryantii TaxID=2161 RepID=A0A2A2H0P8_METBR|nr:MULTISPECIES: Mrp/NBP35 family ATP-binding protein [Methanobacterium]OEC87496.1 ATP-binding protein [Methanobacterium sp. A39]PAV02904.1 ATP-binding protein [Methanobacterium bryantii]